MRGVEMRGDPHSGARVAWGARSFCKGLTAGQILKQVPRAVGLRG